MVLACTFGGKFFDVFAAHRTDSFKDMLDDSDFKIIFVPASCTGELQPLDSSK